MKMLRLFIPFMLVLTAHAFEANAIWVKGKADMELMRKLDPQKKIDAVTLRSDEEVSLYVSYRAPARDAKGWAKVTYRFSLTLTDGTIKGSNPEDTLAGEGEISDEHANQWAVSRGKITLSFDETEPCGIYRCRVVIKDHVGKQEITCITNVHLK